MLTTGDNYVISQQTARACLKYTSEPTNLPPSAQYLAQSTSPVQISSVADWKEDGIQLRILEELARQTIANLHSLVRQGTPWKDLNWECVAVSRAHVEVFILK